MFKLNVYNLEFQRKKLIGYLLFLNIGISWYLYATCVEMIVIVSIVDLPPCFLIVWFYLLLWHLKLKKMFYAEDLRLTRANLTNKEKRGEDRYTIRSNHPVLVSFFVVNNKFLLEFKKKKIGRVLDISETGIFVQLNSGNVVQGGGAMKIKINLPGGKKVFAEGLIVRVDKNKCGIAFVKNSKVTNKLISKYIFTSQMKDSENDTSYKAIVCPSFSKKILYPYR